MSHKKPFQAAGRKPDASAINKLLKLFSQGKAEVLEAEARQFVAKYPQQVFGHKALAASLTLQKKNREALAVLETAIQRFPSDSELRTNLSAALIHAGQFEAASASADEAIRLDPKNAGAYCNKGLALKQMGSWRPALETYHRAIELNPSDFTSLNNAGVALMELEMPEQAVQCFEAAVVLNPAYHDAAFNLARAHEELKFLKDARGEFENLLRAQPEHDRARASLAHLIRKDCDFAAAELQEGKLLERLRAGKVTGEVAAFPVLSMPGFNRSDQLAIGRQNALWAYGHLMNASPATPAHAGSRELPLRIGYLSADFHLHATAMLMVGVLESHDRSVVEIHGYSHGRNDGSPMRKRVESAFSVFHDIRSLSFTDAARKISDDGIDILVDLKGYTKDARLEICALRPAPVTVNWLGYPGSLGHPVMADYLIGDPIVTPLEHQSDYSETLALMPHCYQPNDHLREIGPQPSRASCGLPTDGLVFCSFNQAYKITAEVFESWCRILAAVPNSVLWLLVEREEAKENLLNQARKHGISSSRLVFARNMAIADHLGRLKNADLALDTFPYGSHTTGSDALWAGVPLVAIKGDTFAGRVSASLLSNVGLPELITPDAKSAADLVIALAQDPSRLRQIRTRLDENRLRMPLFDTGRFTRNLEQLYRMIWDQHLQGIREPIVLKD